MKTIGATGADISAVCAQQRKAVEGFHAAFLEARGRHAALASYATATEAMDALAQSSPLTPEERGALTALLVREARRAQHALWMAMLLAGYEPMLLCAREGLEAAGGADLDQCVLIAFLDAVTSSARVGRAGAFTPKALQRQTRRRLLVEVAHLGERRPTAEYLEEEHGHDASRDEEEERCRESLAARARSAIERSGAGDDVIELTLATCAGSESMQEFVDRRYGSLSDRARAAKYEDLRRKRARLFTKIRAELLTQTEAG